MWRYRVRRYRVVYEINARARTLRIVAVGHRRDVYEELAERGRGDRRDSTGRGSRLRSWRTR